MITRQQQEPKHAQQHVDELRQRMTALHAERKVIERQVRSRSAVIASVDRHITNLVEQGQEAFRHDLMVLAAGRTPDLLKIQPSVGGLVNVGPALAALVGADALRTAILRDIESIPKGLEPEARAQRLDSIRTDLDRLEREEERLICSAEAQGIDIARRADARPEIVLALTAESL